MPKFDVLVTETTINVIRNVQASNERATRETALAIMEEHTLAADAYVPEEVDHFVKASTDPEDHRLVLRAKAALHT